MIQNLGALGGGQSSGRAINAAGQVVGASDTAGNGGPHALLSNGTMVGLDAWLDANDPAEGAKWTLTEARGVNNLGLITGAGFYDDGPGGLSNGPRAFCWTPARWRPSRRAFPCSPPAGQRYRVGRASALVAENRAGARYGRPARRDRVCPARRLRYAFLTIRKVRSSIGSDSA